MDIRCETHRQERVYEVMVVPHLDKDMEVRQQTLSFVQLGEIVKTRIQQPLFTSQFELL